MQSIAEAVKTLAQSQQPKWGVAVAGVALVVTVCGGMAGTALAPLFLSDAHMSQMFNEHTHLDGHPNALQLHAATEKDVHRLDERTSTLLKKVDDFDARLRDVERQTQ